MRKQRRTILELKNDIFIASELFLKENKSIREIGNILNINTGIISREFKKININTKIHSFDRKYNLNEHYFDIIDTKDKAYILGFLYADGCIGRYGKYNDSYNIILSLVETDKKILEDINIYLNNEKPLSYIPPRNNRYSNIIKNYVS